MKPTEPLTDILNDDSLIDEIVHEYGTPTYVYSADRIREKIRALKSSMKQHLPSSRLLYAVKANQNPVLLQLMQDCEPSLGFDCSSPGELKTAMDINGENTHFIYTGNYESYADLEYVLRADIPVNFDDITSYQRCRELGLPEVVSFRVNPGEGKGAFPGITTAGKDVKFGIPRANIAKAYQMAIDDGVERFGLHTMVGSGILDNDYFPWNCRRMLEIARELEADIGINFEFFDMGGGFGIPYREEDEPLNSDRIFSGVGTAVREFYPENPPVIAYELGRYIIGDAGFILASVTGTKESDKYFTGLDIGMNHFLRPALYNAYHRIVPLGEAASREPRTTDITGQICENTDRTGRNRHIPELHVGDHVAIMDAGAYGFCLASQYNGRPLPAEVLIDDQVTHLIRQRESLDDLNRDIVIPEIPK